MSVLVLVPSRGRPEAAAELLESFLATRRDPKTRLVFLVDSDDSKKGQYPKEYTRIQPPQRTMGGALAYGTRDLGDATVIGMLGDDSRIRTDGWDVMLADLDGVGYVDDGHQDWHRTRRGHEHPTIWFLPRAIVKRFGMAPTGLRHYYMDDYWYELGKATNLLRYRGDILIEHLHPLFETAPMDDTYRRNDRHGSHDRMWFHRWTNDGLARDATILRSLVSPEPRKVFADWHHPALWESLRLLFEERFGWELYSPIGPEWKARAWRFTHEKWKADDYLVFPDARLVGNHWERVEPEYPDTRRRLVTVEQADAMNWDYVLASVAVHQAPFGDLARGWGARFINHIGNARHTIDSRKDTVTLASARLKRMPHKCVIYHQEFDRKVFAYTTPTSNRVSSFMLRLPTTSGDWKWLSEAKGVDWRDFGGEDQNAKGYLVPMSKVADEMRSSGWIWHDKKIGDGYGHVLHNAAAMGRPLIGHASHYAGMLGEPFWKDLKTCISLDNRDTTTALRLFRAIGADKDWHEEMSANIAAEFEKRVNFDTEADEIKAVLA